MAPPHYDPNAWSHSSDLSGRDQPTQAMGPGRPGVYKRGLAWVVEHKAWSAIGALAGIIGVVVAIVGITLSKPSSSNTQTGDQCTASGNNITISCSNPASTTPANRSGLIAPNAKPDPQSALQLATVWPWISGCPAYGSGIAMPVGGGALQDFHSAHDLGPTLAENGAGSWVQGSMYLHLQAAKGKRLEIVDLKPHIQRRDLAPPAWVFIQQSGCGPYPGDRNFVLNLDQPLLTDKGVEPGPLHKTNAPTASLGTGFVVDNGNDTQIRLDASSCRGNYQWTLEIRYVDTGTGEIMSYEVGPLTSYGRADNTVQYVGNPGPDGVIKVAKQTTITGGDPDYFKGVCQGS